MAGEFDRRRRLIIDGAQRDARACRCVMPKGAFYAFPNVSGLFGKRAEGRRRSGARPTSARSCWTRRASPTWPGVDFGSDAHIRLSYATGLEMITRGLRRMAAAVRDAGGLTP